MKRESRIDRKSVLTGRTRDHLAPWRDERTLVHAELHPALDALAADARGAGFDFRICSAFRDYDRQLVIWNEKARGVRPVHDDEGKRLDWSALSARERLFAILRWSAVPGASRHHWGTDIDVFNAAAMPEGYTLQLVPDEYAPGGIFGPFSAWLEDRAPRHGFHRPYREDRGGVHPEPWHLSYAPVAGTMSRDYTIVLFEETVADAPLELKEAILENLAEVYSKYVMNVAPA
jgi:LAS superfamily LD-carboxypeptidase LdcB